MSGSVLRRPATTLAIGVLAGLLSGLLGIGGGLVVGPLLVLLAIPMKRALGSALAVVAPVAAVGVVTEFFTAPEHLVLWAAALVAAGGQAGVLMGERLVRKVSSSRLRTFFILLLVFVALRNLGIFGEIPADAQPGLFPSSPFMRCVSALLLGVIGGLCALMFGVGGGVVVVPGLIFGVGGFSFHYATGTSLLAMVPTAMVGVALAMKDGRVSGSLVKRLAPAALVAAAFGVWIRNRWMEPSFLAVLFAIFLLYTAWNLLNRDSERS